MGKINERDFHSEGSLILDNKPGKGRWSYGLKNNLGRKVVAENYNLRMVGL